MGAPFSEAANNHSEGGEDDDDQVSKPPSTRTAAEESLSTYLSLVTQYLSVFMIDNATFLAERCVAQHPSNLDARYMLALCYFRSGSFRRALVTLDQSFQPTQAMRFLASQAALQLKEYARAEEVLLKDCRMKYLTSREQQQYGGGNASIDQMDDWIVQTTPCPLPNGAAGLALLANICRKSNRRERAIRYYKLSLQLDPFLWTSFQALCELGVATDYSAAEAFGVLQPMAASQNGGGVEQYNQSGAWQTSKTPLQTIETPAGAIGGTVLRSRFETPGLTPISVNHSMMQMHPPETPQQSHPYSGSMPPPMSNTMVLRRAREVAARQYYPPSPETPLTHVTRNMRYLRGLGPPSEQSAMPLTTPRVDHSTVGSMQRHLFMSASSENWSTQPPPTATNMAITNTNVQSAVASHHDDADKPAPATTAASPAVSAILELLATLGAAYQKLCQYQCREAIAILQTAPMNQQVTGWVLHQQGRAFSEMNDFANAQRCLELMVSKDPGRLQGLEILSTVYWQLKKEVELAYLSQQVVDWDRLSPEAWCVVGNCFSLQKDHESALAFFKRSLQLNPDYTYTHTLSGYEYMANEDFDKAIACFRQALRIDERHYNAWYGLGAIYHRQEKYDLAEFHFEKAVAINPSSSVLRCNLGIAQHSNGKSYQALETLAGAFQLDPRNPQARFQRATIYSSLMRYEEALAELKKVCDAAPREATIHFAMGKVLKRLGRPEQAMKCFLTAMDLDPKDNQMIKSAMDKLDEVDVDEETIAGF
ncbi:hypothetical protein MPSEU_000282100 [Mayamaea pseudoterrestris]|nr:hypothetical protein MPSEU_000282100 [Mayamaea pseudoterrestris]